MTRGYPPKKELGPEPGGTPQKGPGTRDQGVPPPPVNRHLQKHNLPSYFVRGRQKKSDFNNTHYDQWTSVNAGTDTADRCECSLSGLVMPEYIESRATNSLYLKNLVCIRNLVYGLMVLFGVLQNNFQRPCCSQFASWILLASSLPNKRRFPKKCFISCYRKC